MFTSLSIGLVLGIVMDAAAVAVPWLRGAKTAASVVGAATSVAGRLRDSFDDDDEDTPPETPQQEATEEKASSRARKR